MLSNDVEPRRLRRAAADAEGADDRTARRRAPRRRRLPAPDRAGARRDRSRSTLLRARFAAKFEIEPEEHARSSSSARTAAATSEVDRRALGAATATLCGRGSSAARIEAGAPAWGKEIDESILPAEAGLDRTHVSLHEGLLSRARSRSRGCTTAGTSTAGCACCGSTRRRATRFATPGRSSAASRAPSRASRSRMSHVEVRRTPSSRSARSG